MEPFEPVRNEARSQHDLVARKGRDPLRPLEFIKAALKDLDLGLEFPKPGNAALKGAKALYDEQSGTVFCEDAGTDVERALLIAHELGHARLHETSSACTSHDIDPSRSTEAAPVGLQRVEDYGAHERRELQANVFAREFLLPRDLALRLHVGEGLSASEISARTGLPIALVRQQLLDALLLPPVEEAPPSVSKIAPIDDDSQKRAVAHRGSAFQLQAGPGTGKTRTLVDRVVSLIKEGVDPASILVLTFSNRAAGELAERLHAAVQDVSAKIWIGTFHAFGLDLVRRYHDRLGLPADPQLFDRSDAIAMLEDVLPTLPLVHYRNLWDPAIVLKDVIVAISRAKDELADPAKYRALAEAMRAKAVSDEEKLAAAKCLEIASLYDHYEEGLRKHGGVDFGDLIMRPALLLASDQTLRSTLQLRHRHVLVDEYQDVNRASARLLKTVAGDGKRLWVVGDARQSIYRFRGASSSNMRLFPSDYPGAKADQLEVNYRSTGLVVNTFVEVSKHIGASEGMMALNLDPARGRGTARPEIRRFITPTDEEGGIAASIRELETAGIKLREQAVLCRSNKRLNDVAAALEARGIPILHLGSLFEREEIRNLLALLSLAVEPFGGGLVRVASMARYDIPLEDVHALLGAIASEKKAALETLPGIVRKVEISADGRQGLDRLIGDLKGLSPNDSGWDYLTTYLLDRTDLGRTLGSPKTIMDRMRAVAVWQFLNFVREGTPIKEGRPIQRTLDRVRQLVLLAEERDLRQVPAAALHLDAVRLMTVHGSKGLEFEAVHIPGMTVSSFPAQRRPPRCPMPEGLTETKLSAAEEAEQSHAHEEGCLFFVALSRARTQLRLYLAAKQANGKNRSASPYLDWLSGSLADNRTNPSIIPYRGDPLVREHVDVKWDAAWEFSDAQLKSYDKCPRRYLYTHVLGIGAARKPTAFSRTNDCLYELLRWLSEARLKGEPTVAEAEAAFEEMWKDRGPADHAFAPDYRRLASRMIKSLIGAGAGRKFKEAKPLALDLSTGRVFVRPNEIAEAPNGTVLVRHVRTGQKRSDEYKRLEYVLLVLAARAAFGHTVVVEALHLTDDVADTVAIKGDLEKHKKSAGDLLHDIKAGKFPPEPDAFSCPRCPHFFVCAAVPAGPIQVKVAPEEA